MSENQNKTVTSTTINSGKQSNNNNSNQSSQITSNGNSSQSSQTSGNNATSNTTTTVPTTTTTATTTATTATTTTNTATDNSMASQDQKNPEELQQELEESDTNLIINYIPPSMNEGALGALFSPYGTMHNIKIVVDPHTGHSRGYGFVKYESTESAAQALQALNGYMVAGKKLKVAYSRPQSKEIQNANLYVTNIPKNWDNQKLGQVFKPFGYVVESRILLDQDNKSRGVGFVRMDNHSNAVKAIVGINGHRVDGGNELVVKLAQKKNQNRRWDNSHGKDNDNTNRENKNFNNNTRKSGGNFNKQGDAMSGEFYNKRNSSHRGRQYRRRGGSSGSMMDPADSGFYPPTYDTYSQPATGYYGTHTMESSGMRAPAITTNANVLSGGDTRPYSAQSYSIMVRNLPEHYNVDHLIKLYAPFGPIQSVNIQKAKSGHPQTYGVVSYFFADDAKNAAEQTHGRLEANHHLEVTWQ